MENPIAYKIVFTKKSQKAYQKLPDTGKPKIARAIAALSQNPFQGKKLEGELKGGYSIRAWPYRVIYSVDGVQKVVNINSILHRQGAYK